MFFQQHEQCEQLTTAVQTAAGQEAKAKRYRSGAIVWGGDALPDRVFRLSAGRVNILSLDKAGNELLLRRVKPGETFGEICFCGHRTGPHGILARAVAPSEIASMSYGEFRRFMKEDSGFAESVLVDFCVRLAEMEQRTQILALHDATARLAELLRYLAQSKGSKVPGRRSVAVLTISHSELAAMSALSRPHVSLLMTRFRDWGWVSYQRNTPLQVHTDKIGR